MNQTAETTSAKRSDSRPTRVGLVTSAPRQKTIKVTIDYMVRHAKYGKFLKRSTELQVHDEQNVAGKGDTVEIAECRPLSKTKRWRLVRVMAKAPKGAGE